MGFFNTEMSHASWLTDIKLNRILLLIHDDKYWLCCNNYNKY